jgi:hypothetical protein
MKRENNNRWRMQNTERRPWAMISPVCNCLSSWSVRDAIQLIIPCFLFCPIHQPFLQLVRWDYFRVKVSRSDRLICLQRSHTEMKRWTARKNTTRSRKKCNLVRKQTCFQALAQIGFCSESNFSVTCIVVLASVNHSRNTPRFLSRSLKEIVVVVSLRTRLLSQHGNGKTDGQFDHD